MIPEKSAVMEIGEKIRAIRIDNGLSQEQFAEMFFVTRQAVSNWETGKNYPDMRILGEISTRFGVPLDDLIKPDKAFIEDIDNTRLLAGRLKKGLVAISICLAAALLYLAMPHFVKSIYYDPGEITFTYEYTMDGEDETRVQHRLEQDMAVLSNLCLPGEWLYYFESEDRGMGRYDIMLQYGNMGWKENGEAIISGQIVRNQMQIFNPDSFMNSPSASFAWNSSSEGTESLRKDLATNSLLQAYCDYADFTFSCISEDEDRCYEAYISFDEIMDYTKFLDWIEKNEDLFSGGIPWVTVVTDEDRQAGAAGFYMKPINESMAFDKEKYPYLFGYEDVSTDEGEWMGDEEIAKQHLISMLKYIKDMTAFRKMILNTASFGYTVTSDGYAEEAIDYVEANGLRVYGIALTVYRDQIMKLKEDPAVFSIFIRYE